MLQTDKLNCSVCESDELCCHKNLISDWSQLLKWDPKKYMNHFIYTPFPPTYLNYQKYTFSRNIDSDAANSIFGLDCTACGLDCTACESDDLCCHKQIMTTSYKFCSSYSDTNSCYYRLTYPINFISISFNVVDTTTGEK